MAERVDFQQEADGCFRLAEAETQADVRTILMGMGYGWLTLATHQKASRQSQSQSHSHSHSEPFDEPTDEPDDL